MLSPAGMDQSPNFFNILEKNVKDAPRPGKAKFYVTDKIWTNYWSPFDAMRKSGRYFGNKIIRNNLVSDIPTLNDEEKQALLDYMH